MSNADCVQWEEGDTADASFGAEAMQRHSALSNAEYAHLELEDEDALADSLGSNEPAGTRIGGGNVRLRAMLCYGLGSNEPAGTCSADVLPTMTRVILH